MKSRLSTLAAATLVAMILVPAALAQDKRDLVKDAKIGLKEAIATALRVRAGSAVEAELEGSRGQDGKMVPVFEVVIVTDQHELYEVPVDARSGQAGEAKKEEGAEEMEELASFRSALRHTELDLVTLVGKAEEIIKGVPVSAILEMEEMPECEVVICSSRYLIEVDLEGRAGHLVELGLQGIGQDDREDEGEARDRNGARKPGREEGEEEDEGEEEAERESRHPQREMEGRKGGEEAREAGPGAKSGLAEEATDLRERQGTRRRSPVVPTPLRDGVRFSPRITHLYLPLSTVGYTVLESEDEKVIREVQSATKTIAGVECLVLAEMEYEKGQLKEISYNYFAQDEEGNVYYFGEDVDDYEDGEVVGHGGAWLVGKNAKEPCLFMPASLKTGFQFKSENSPPDAEEWNEIDALDATLRVPAGQFERLLVVKESDKPDRWQERKYYAAGVGLISENRELNLVAIRRTEDR